MNLKRFSFGARGNAAPALTDAPNSKFKVGQVWNYRTRPEDVGSTFTVVKVEESEKLGVIVHISLGGLKFKNPHHPSGFSETVSHMPFSETAIEDSVTTMVRDGADLPEFEDGYAEWRRAFDAGKAGVFTITVAEAVGGMEAAMG